MKTQKRIYRTAVFISLFLCVIIIFWGFQVCAEELTDAQKEVWKSVEVVWEFIVKGDLEALTNGQEIKGLIHLMGGNL